MDAISFVLGIQSAHLRSNNLSELIYRSGNLQDGEADVVAEEGSKRRRGGPKHTSVTAFYYKSDGEELIFSRTYLLSILIILIRFFLALILMEAPSTALMEGFIAMGIIVRSWKARVS